jgi:hypothetical protein
MKIVIEGSFAEAASAMVKMAIEGDVVVTIEGDINVDHWQEIAKEVVKDRSKKSAKSIKSVKNRKATLSYWSKMTPAERKAEMSRRAKVRTKNQMKQALKLIN